MNAVAISNRPHILHNCYYSVLVMFCVDKQCEVDLTVVYSNPEFFFLILQCFTLWREFPLTTVVLPPKNSGICFYFITIFLKNHYLACIVGTVLRQITPVLCFSENVYKLGFLHGVLGRAMLKYNHGLFSKLIIFSKTSRWALGPTQILFNFQRRPFTGVKRPGRQVYRSPLSRVEVKNH
jgi:hypothetical protein